MTLGDADDTQMPSAKMPEGVSQGWGLKPTGPFPQPHPPYFSVYQRAPNLVIGSSPRPEMPWPPPTLQLGEQRLSLAGTPKSLPRDS